MFQVLSGLLRPQVLIRNKTRTFLSQAYYCNEIWDRRLNSPILQRVNLDVFYHELDQRFQKTKQISAVDVDIFANAIKDDLFIDELLDLVHKLRLTAETSKTLESTGHALIRTLLVYNRIEELLRVLDDRLNYGVFVDDYTANILMDAFWKEKNFVAGSLVASQVMLQEDFKHPLTINLALLHCYNYLLKPTEWPQPPPLEEPEEEIKVRVRYVRNPYNDEHFDLRDGMKIAGKTIAMAAKGHSDPISLSLRTVGLALLGKKFEIKPEMQLVKEIVDALPDDLPSKQDLLSLRVVSEDVQAELEKRVIESAAVTSEKDIANQCEVFAQWEQDRVNALEEQKQLILKAERLAEIEKLKASLKEKEQKLWFFENEEKIELTIEEATSEAPTRAVKVENKKEEEAYIPPEVTSRKTL